VTGAYTFEPSRNLLRNVPQVFVYGNSLRAQLVAIVVPDPDTLLPWAASRFAAIPVDQILYEVVHLVKTVRCAASDHGQCFLSSLLRRAGVSSRT